MIDDVQQPENQTQSARRELYEIYADSTIKPRYKKKLIESLDEIYGYDLAFLVGLIMHSEFSGNLNVISQSNEISGISFSHGKITRIDLNDKDTFMGELLIKEGLVDRARLLQVLQDQTKPLGELLITNKIATKEQIISVLVKQMRLRLSRYINSTKYRVNFSESEIADPGLSISYPEYLVLAHDWVAGRFDGEWLKLHYMELSEGVIEIPKETVTNDALKDLALSKELDQILKNQGDNKKFSKMSAQIKSEKDQEYFLKCFHYGIMSGQVILKHDPQAEAYSDSVLKNIYNACSKKTGAELLETLAHILKYKPTEIDAIFQAINNYVHTYTGDDHDMKNNMFRIVLEMISKKQFYYDEIIKKHSVQADPAKAAEISKRIVEVYRDLLTKNLFLAIEKLKRMNDYAAHTPKIKLYMVWAKALMIHQNNIKINIADLERDFLQILPEDKDTAEYYYVKAILASLKKEENLAKTFYDQSIKLNSELKKYPPIKQTGSFIKNLFKMSIFIVLIGIGLQAQGQNKLPFVYLNQYFNYKIQSDDSIQINETNFNLSDMVLQRNNDLEIELTGTLTQFRKTAAFMTYTQADQKVKDVNHSTEGEKYSVKEKSLANADAICLIQKSDYTQLKICKSLNLSSDAGIKSYTVNGQAIESEGTVILNDKSEKIQFNVVKKNNDFLSLETTRRNVLPARIDKPENSEDMDVQFVEAGNSRAGWDEKLNLNQNYMPLKLDNLITLKQGIYFNNSVTAEAGISEIYIDRSKIQQKFYNKIIVEPLVAYNQVTGKSNTTDAVLISDPGIGISISGDHYMDNGRNIFGSLSYYSTKIISPNNNITIIAPAKSLISATAGYKFNLSDRFSLSGIARAKEDLFFNEASLTSIESTKAFSIMLGGYPEYNFFNFYKLSMNAGVGGYLIMPTSVPNTSITEMGFLIEADLKASYKVDWGRVLGGFSLGHRSQKNNTYTYAGNYVIYKLGMTYLF